ncbi:hypothetical protein Z043_114519, partial [Scleropages formosus]
TNALQVFARRALGKVNELAKLEEMSCSPASSETTMAFREATIKAPWHRTITERLLMEMFEGHAAQLLAVIEALWDTSHRPLHTGIPEEPEMREVVMELLSVGVSILTGIGVSSGNVRADNIDFPPALSGIDPSSTLLEMAKAGKNTVSVEAAVKFVKLLFLYGQWDMFRCLSGLLVPHLKSLEELSFMRMEVELTLLEAVEPLVNIQKSEYPDRDKLGEVVSESSNLLALAETLHTSVCGSAQWARTLYLLCKVSFSYNFAHLEPMAMAEMAVLLAAVLESNPGSALPPGRITTRQENSQRVASADQRSNAAAIHKETMEQLQMVLEVVEHAIESMNLGTALFFPRDGTAVCDTARLRVRECSSFPEYPSEPSKADSKRSLTPRENVENPAANTERARAEAALLEKIGKNKISKAMFLMQKALLSHKKDPNSSEATQLLEEALTLVEKTEVEEKRLIGARACTQAEEKEGPEGRSKVPPPPILLSRTHHSMTFAPAPYALNKQVRWYNLYGREAKGINLKVRLGDCSLPGTGEQVPALGEPVLWVDGLEPNRTYVFAVAAYDAKGKLIGGAIGETTRPLLASLPLPLLTAWAFLAQLFLKSIFMQTDIHVQEGALYCDVLSDRGPLIWGQVARLAECEHLLVALDLALWLNDTSAALQAVVGCYGLLAPLIYHRVQSEAVVQVVIKCLVVLQEIPGVFHQKHPMSAAESLLHMVACMTYYVSKVLRLSNQHRLAAAMIDRGRKLLQEANDALLAMSKTVPASLHLVPEQKAASNQLGRESSKQLRALEASATMSKIMSISLHDDPTRKRAYDLVVQGDICILYSVIISSSLKTAFHDVMKYKWKPFFLEIAVHLLQRGIEENELELVLKWGQDILGWLSRRNEAYKKGKKSSTVQGKGQDEAEKDLKKYTSSVIKYSKNLAGRASCTDKKWRKQLATLRTQSKDWESWALNTLRRRLPLMLRRCQQRRHLRRVCSEEAAWRCHLNLKLAVCHLALLYRSLEQWHGLRAQHSYSRLDPMLFSLASVGSLVNWRNAAQHTQTPKTPPPLPKEVPEPLEKMCLQKGKEATPSREAEEESNIVESEVDIDLNTPRTQVTNDSDYGEPSMVSETTVARTIPQHLDSLTKAALHLRRAMVLITCVLVLAHRGAHWTSLQWTCRVLWDQTIAITQLVERGSFQGEPSSLTVDQVYTVVTPLLILAADLLLDMMYRAQVGPFLHSFPYFPCVCALWVVSCALALSSLLTSQLWKAYKEDDNELEASMHFSGSVDDTTLMDFRWLKALVLRVLELLYLQEKWETLAHLALLFNGLTHERYTHAVTPLLVHAQRKLLERVHQFGGPSPPQPHFSRTEKLMGVKITSRNYVGKQLLSAWTSKTGGQESAELQRALVLISVPLDVDDALFCFREMAEKGSYAVQTFRHSRTLLLLLLADTQPSFEVPFCKEGTGHSQSMVEFNVDTSAALSIGPVDLSNEDFSAPSSIYSSPLPASQLQTVISSYTNSIKYLQANNLNSLCVLALHDLGNLYFYKGNKRVAHTYWNKALDSALQCSGVLESWDGVSWAGCAPQEVLYHAGIWGCLQGAMISAKIAQYLLTSDVSQRTRCCLLSALLFRTLLGASLPHPQPDWQYSFYVPGPELIPGLDLFSDPLRANLGTAVSSLSFLCHWLYASSHFLKILPPLSLYLHVVGTVCRDPQHVIKGRILKVRVLTEMGLFRAAIREVGTLLRGENILQPHGSFLAVDKQQVKEFDTSKPLLEPCNLEAMGELANWHLNPELALLFGPRMSRRLEVARAQLLLAICSSIHCLPEPQGQNIGAQGYPDALAQYSSSNPELRGSPTSDSDDARTGDRKPVGLWLDPKKENVTPSKALLLREVTRILMPLLSSTQLPVPDAEELEVAVEVRLLLSAVSLRQGKAASSADQAVAALHLFQDSPLLGDRNLSPTHKVPSSNLRQSRARSEQGSLMEADLDCGPWLGDLPCVVEASERLGALWLRCRLTVVRALAEHFPGTAIHPGVDSSTKAAKVLEEGLQDTETWCDPETRALLLLQGAILAIHSGRPKDESASLLQEAANLLSDCRCLSTRAALTLATANLQLSELKGPDGYSLHTVIQKLLQQQVNPRSCPVSFICLLELRSTPICSWSLNAVSPQLSALGEHITLGEGGQVVLLSSLGIRNMYLPQLPLLAKATMHLGNMLQGAGYVPGVVDGQAVDPDQWLSARRTLDSALRVSQASSSRDKELEADILYCRGQSGTQEVCSVHNEPFTSITLSLGACVCFCLLPGLVESRLVSLNECQPQDAVDTFLEAISIAQSHSHNLWCAEGHPVFIRFVRRCYLEIALVYLQQWEQVCSADHRSPESPSRTEENQQQPTLSRSLICCELQPLLFSLCLRAAAQVSEAHANRVLLCGVSGGAGGDNVQLSALEVLPEFVSSDLLIPCGGLDEAIKNDSSPSPDDDRSPTGQKHTQLTWIHLARYQAHLLNLHHIATRPVTHGGLEGMCSLGLDSSLTLRLAQLHSFFSACLPSYRKRCCAPKPLTALLKPSTPQPGAPPAADRGVSQAAMRLSPLVCADKEQALLLFAFHPDPLSALGPTAGAVSQLHCGRLWVSLESPSVQKQQSSRSSENGRSRDPHTQELQERTRACLAQIRALLKPHSDPTDISKEPPEPDVQSLGDLERCFNPAGGAVVTEAALVSWLASLLL